MPDEFWGNAALQLGHLLDRLDIASDDVTQAHKALQERRVAGNDDSPELAHFAGLDEPTFRTICLTLHSNRTRTRN